MSAIITPTYDRQSGARVYVPQRNSLDDVDVRDRAGGRWGKSVDVIDSK